jgi:membrane protein implicated in regulation of membrane protease activity
MSMDTAIKILFSIIILLLIPIAVVLGFIGYAMWFGYIIKDLPDLLPVDLAIKCAAILAIMFVIHFIYSIISEANLFRKEHKKLKEQAISRFFSGPKDSRKQNYYPPND